MSASRTVSEILSVK